jgi:protein CrcB
MLPRGSFCAPITLAINILGSFLIGLVAEYWALRTGLPQMARLFLTTGVLGGFTTFSAFSLETALLWERGQCWASTLYVCASVALVDRRRVRRFAGYPRFDRWGMMSLDSWVHSLIRESANANISVSSLSLFRLRPRFSSVRMRSERYALDFRGSTRSCPGLFTRSRRG